MTTSTAPQGDGSASPEAPRDPRDLIIVSDLHLSGGRSQPKTGRFSRLESFFYDEEFVDFVDYVIVQQSSRRREATLVFNGDIFDFLAMVDVPGRDERQTRRIAISRNEQKFGLGTSPSSSVWKLETIFKGHLPFFRALLRWLDHGHDILVIRGNHDLELFWPEVKDALISCLATLAKDEGLTYSVEDLLGRIAFEEWLYYEKDRIYIEHGNQYELSNALRYNLNPVLPKGTFKSKEQLLDYPIGSLFVRYVYNKLRLIDPFRTRIVSYEEYTKLLHRRRFLDFSKTILLHLPFLARTVKSAHHLETRGMRAIKKRHDERLAELGERTGLGDKVKKLDKMRAIPTLTTKYSLSLEMLKPYLKNAGLYLGAIIIALFGWITIFTAISSSDSLASSVLGKSALLAVFFLLSGGLLFFMVTYVSAKLQPSTEGEDDEFRSAAARVAKLLDVPIVCMGHNHIADIAVLRGGRSIYLNSGTWVPSATSTDQIRSHSQQFTFIRVWGDEATLLKWNPGTSRWEQVILLEERKMTSLERILEGTPRSTP